jgi:dTDP-4-amino-4,6-dideoxyglucose
MRAYQNDYAHVSLPVTDSLAERILCLPTGTSVSEQDVRRICQLLRLAVTDAARVRGRLELVK